MTHRYPVQFRSFMSDGLDEEQTLNLFFSAIRRRVLASVRVDEEQVRFSFPSNFASFMPADSASPSPMRLAAWTDRPGNMLSEATLKPGYDKGSQIVGRAVTRGVFDPPIGQTAKAKLANTITTKLRDVGQELGLLFELKVFEHLVTGHNLKISSDSKTTAQAQEEIETHRKALNQRLRGHSQQSAQWFAILSSHAAELSADIVRVAEGSLGTPLGRVTFVGGNAFHPGITHAGDIVISKVGQEAMGFSLKYGSEKRINIKETTVSALYQAMGGRSIKRFEAEIATGDTVKVALDNFHTLVKRMNGRQLGFLLSWLMSGHRGNKDGTPQLANVKPAYMNYVTGDRAVGYSPAILSDFYVDKGQLNVKRGSEITINQSESTLSILVHNGSKHGTRLQFDVRPTGVVVARLSGGTSQG